MTEKSTFEKVTRSERLLYGPRKLLLCGFAAEGQKNSALFWRWSSRRYTEGLAGHGAGVDSSGGPA